MTTGTGGPYRANQIDPTTTIAVAAVTVVLVAWDGKAAAVDDAWVVVTWADEVPVEAWWIWPGSLWPWKCRGTNVITGHGGSYDTIV